MKPIQKLSLFRAQKTSTSGTGIGRPAATFGQARAESMQKRYDTRVLERQKLKRAEYAAKGQSDQSVHQGIQAKGEIIGREIGRLQQEMNNQEDSNQD